MSEQWRLLVFGASGAIGQKVVERALSRGWSVTAVTRGPAPARDDGVTWRSWDPLTAPDAAVLSDDAPFDGVCWAQGANLADSLSDFDIDRHRALYDANVGSVLISAAALVSSGLLRRGGARLAVVSSIWQERARTDKLSYTVSKAALGGLVRAASVDLGRSGHLINAVLPGVLDTPMTRANLSAEQVDMVAGMTTLGRLPDLHTLAETILFLCSADNSSLSGQSLAVDLGMSNARLI
jgi:3-oxoacyl-[acyl-carrier protein] reductase